MSKLKVGSKVICCDSLDGYTIGKIYKIHKIHPSFNICEDCIELINDNGDHSIFTVEIYFGLSYKKWFKLLNEDRCEKLMKLNNL